MSTPRADALRALVGFAVPATVVMLLSGLFLVIDTYFIVRLGTVQLAGATLAFPVFMILLTALGGGIGIGISAAVARRFGRGGREDAQSCVGSCLGLGLGVSFLFCLAYLGLAERLLQRTRLDPALVQAALDFSQPIFMGSPLLGLSLTLSNLLRSERKVVQPAVMLVMGGVVNAVSAPVLMFGVGPLPALGLKGAGVATVLGFAASGLLGVWLMTTGRSLLSIRPSVLRWDPEAAREILRIALPTILTYVANNGTYMVLALLWAHFGTEAVAGYGLAIRFEYVLILTLFGLGSAVVTLGGERLGAGDLEGLLRLVRPAGRLALGGTAVAALCLFFQPQVWFSLFGAELGVADAGGGYFQVVAMTYPFYALGLVYSYAYQTIARAEWGLALGMTRTVLVALPGVGLTVWSGGSARAAAVILAVSFGLYGLLSAFVFPRALRTRASLPERAPYQPMGQQAA